MMRFTGIILFFILFPVSVQAAQIRETGDAVAVPDRSQRFFYDTQFSYIYEENPAMLSWWVAKSEDERLSMLGA